MQPPDWEGADSSGPAYIGRGSWLEAMGISRKHPLYSMIQIIHGYQDRQFEGFAGRTGAKSESLRGAAGHNLERFCDQCIGIRDREGHPGIIGSLTYGVKLPAKKTAYKI
jgi:hypothetical protein